MTDDDSEPVAETGASPTAESATAAETAGGDSQRSDPNTTTDSTAPMASNTNSDLVDAARLRQLLEYALLATFVIVALFAALSFYSQVGRAIEIWVADPYEPIAKATVNLGLLLIAVAGVSRQLARLAGRDAGSEVDATDE